MKLKTGKVIIHHRPQFRHQEMEEAEIFMAPPELEDLYRPESRNSGNATTVTWSGQRASTSQNWSLLSQDANISLDQRRDSQPSSNSQDDSQTTTPSIVDSQLSEIS